jgi:hypothetical protein
MSKKFVLVSFRKTDHVIAQVETELSGEALENAVVAPEEFMRDYFGEAG